MINSDDYFHDELDSAFIHELDAIEHSRSPKPSAATALSKLVRVDSDGFDLSFNFDEAELQRVESDAYRVNVASKAGSSKGISRSPLKDTRQTTLFGDTLPNQPRKVAQQKPATQRTKFALRNPFGKKANKTKKWDQTAFAKSGWKKSTTKGKEKANSFAPDDQIDREDDEEPLEFEQFPSPYISHAPPPPMKLKPDFLAVKDWVYPLNQSRRDYQFNIVKHSLFDNTLVSLPTGLGKTFIAGVVMLNYYRWFPDGKVVFVAPTKPLVAQQIDACHKSCGIPGRDAVELTGQNPRAQRARAWVEKRVFYMTPQTFLNDLVTENCDARDIILLVIDEAHKGTGDYAYAQVMRFLMAKNPHFRVLALTATPGGTPEAVQAIVDSLHISHIEIRDERSLDLKPYLFKKHIDQHVIKMSGEILKIQGLLAKVMESILAPLARAGILYVNNVVNLHPFRCQIASGDIHKRRDAGQLKWAFGPLSTLGILARAMGYLMESSMEMCHRCLLEITDGAADETGKKKPAKKKLAADPQFQTVMKEIELQRNRGFSVHPKMEKLKALAIQHFATAQLDEQEAAAASGSDAVSNGGGTRMMVFATFRPCVEEIVEMLNREQPLIRAASFIGQGADKQGKKGLAQKDQLALIKRFKAGDINVLVSTSIGEEGLDIGEVDMIICYEAQKTPIRMLQRVGRTGRKREGHVGVLLAEGREEDNWRKAQESYEDVQYSIVRGEQLELFSDVERLIPESVKPECLQMIMEIEEYVRDPPKEKKTLDGSPSIKVGKRKRNTDMSRNVPEGASTGFVPVSKLLVKGSAKRRKVSTKEFDPNGARDDETDMEIEAGLHGPSRAPSLPKAKKIRTADDKGKKAKCTSTNKQCSGRSQSLSTSQFARQGEDDSDDMEIERGIVVLPHTPTPSPKSTKHGSSYPDRPIVDTIALAARPLMKHSLPSDVNSSPDRPLANNKSFKESPLRSVGGSAQMSPSQIAGPSHITTSPHEDDRNMSWLLESDSDSDVEVLSTTAPISWRTASKTYEDIELISDSHSVRPLQPAPSERAPSISSSLPLSRERSAKECMRNVEKGMPPLDLPDRLSRPSLSLVAPEPTLPIRDVSKQRKRSVILEALDSSPMSMPPPSQRRLQRKTSSSPTPPRPHTQGKEKFRIKLSKDNPVFDLEAEHSGDEESEGSSDDGPPESESDRQFLRGLPETQLSPSYDQSLVYRQSLLTQAPQEHKGPVFVQGPARRSAFGGGRNTARLAVSSSPLSGEMSGSNDYEFGSFVVHDDDDLLLLSD